MRLRPESVQDAFHNPVTLGISPDGGRIALAGVASEKPNEGGFITDDGLESNVRHVAQIVALVDQGETMILEKWAI
jgi:hypothetical protein